MLRPFIVISAVSWASAAFAEPVALVRDELKVAVSGALIEIDTPLGTKLPIRFGQDGLVSAESQDLAPYLGSAKDRGRWWVEDEKLCSKWFRWFDAEVRCITVKQDGSRLYWLKDDGESGTATLIESATLKSPPAAEPDRPPVVLAQATPQVKAPRPPVAKSKPFVEATLAPPVPRAAGAVAAETSALPAPPSQPIVVAEAGAAQDDVTPPDTTLPRDGVTDAPIMRVGGSGLLEASSRVPLERPVALEVRDAGSPPATTAPAKVAMLPKAVRAQAAAPAPARQRAKAPAVRKPPLAVSKSAASKSPVSKSAPPIVTSSVLAVPSYRVRGVDDDDVLNVRQGPSEEHVSVATIPASGRRVEITGSCQQTWCPIRYGNVKGWVNSLYLAQEIQQGSSSRVYFAKP